MKLKPRSENFRKTYNDDTIRLILLTPATRQNTEILAGAFGRDDESTQSLQWNAGYAKPPDTMQGTQTFLERCIRIRKELGLPSGT